MNNKRDQDARRLKPDRKVRENWDTLISLLILFAMIEIPLRLALGYDPRSNGLVLLFEILMTVCFSADIVVNFTPKPGWDGPSTQRSEVARRYVRTWFFPDLLAAIPFFLLFPPAAYGGSRLLKVARLLQLSRLLKVSRLRGVYHIWKMRHRLSPGVFRLGLFLIGISFFAHWAACGWIALTGTRSYIDAIYWTVTTLTTVGYGDFVPVSGSQKIYTMMVMVAGAGSYGYIIGNFASLLANLDLHRAGRLKKMDQVDGFLKHNSIPADLRRRVWDYFEHLFESHAAAGQSSVFEELPEPIKTEIALHMHRDILEKVPLFHGASEEFLRAVVLKLRPVVHPPDARVVTFGEPGDAMYFIDSGTVEVLSEDGGIRQTLSEGEYFGEMALVLDVPRNATVRCLGFCEFYVLSRQDFDQVLALFPEFAEHVRGTVRERTKNDDG